MSETQGYLPGDMEQKPTEKKPQGYELKTPEQFKGAVANMGEYDEEALRAKGVETRGRLITDEQADAQIAKAMDDLKAKVSPELYDRVVQAAGKPDGEFKTQVANELRQAIGDEAFKQFNADTTVSRPFVPFNRQGASPTSTRAHGEDAGVLRRVNEKPRTLLNVNTEARFYMDETRKITDRAEAVKAMRRLWSLHSEMEGLAKPEHPAILDITRREILRLKQEFGVSTEEELGNNEPKNAENL